MLPGLSAPSRVEVATALPIRRAVCWNASPFRPVGATVRKEFLGRGWKFPFQIDPASGGVAFSEYEQNIRECVTLILGTRPGERQMLPEFGCRIHELMFAPNTSATAQLAKTHVESALKRWEPRIEVTGVDAWPDPGGSIRVHVHYRIKTTQSDQDLALTMNPSG